MGDSARLCSRPWQRSGLELLPHNLSDRAYFTAVSLLSQKACVEEDEATLNPRQSNDNVQKYNRK